MIEFSGTVLSGNFLPTIATFGKYEIYKHNLTLFEPEWVAGLSARLDLFKGGQDYNEFRAYNTQLEIIDLYIQNTNKMVITAIKKYHHKAKTALEQYESLKSSQELTEENLNLYKKSFTEGLATSIEVLDAELALEKVRLEQSQALFDFNVAYAHLIDLCANSQLLITCSKPKETISGEVDSTEIDIGVKVPGRIAEIFITEGQTVKKGDILGRLEGKELDAKLKTVNAALKEAEEQYVLAKKTYNRIKTLYKDGIIPKQQFDEVEYKYNAALQKINATQGKKNEIMAYYDELTIVAPIDGEVTQIISHPGELIATGYPIITILDTNDMWVVFNIREDLLNNIEKDKYIKVYIPAIKETFDMKVTYISAMASFASWKPTNQQNNYDLKTFEIRAKSNNKIKNLRPGMTAVIVEEEKK